MALIQQAHSLLLLSQLHALFLKTSLDLDNFVAAKFLRKCLAFPSPHSLHCARSLFDGIRAPVAFLFNTLICSYLHSQTQTEPLRRGMRLIARVLPDSFSISQAVQGCRRTVQRRMGEAVHGHVVKLGVVSDLFAATVLVEMYMKIGDIKPARKVFDLMPERDLVACIVMLAEYVGYGEIGEARRLLDEMPRRDSVVLENDDICVGNLELTK